MFPVIGRKWAKWLMLGLAVAALAAALSACGSSGSSSSNTSESSGGGSGEKTETASAESGSESSGSSAIAEADANFEKYSQKPEPIELAAIEREIPKGANLAILNVNVPGTKIITKGTKEAAAKLGWHVKESLPPLTPEGFSGALTSILQEKPDALIFLTPFPLSSFRRQLNEFKAAGIPIVTVGANEYPVGGSSPVVASSGLPIDFGPLSELQADTMIHQEGGAPDMALVVDPSVPAWKVVIEKTKEGIEKAGGTYNQIDVGEAEAAKTGAQTIVSYLQAHPEITYVWLTTNIFNLGLPQALKAAGLEVKIGTGAGEQIDVESIEKGSQDSTVVLETESNGWRLADAAARALAGEKIAEPEIPTKYLIVTKENTDLAQNVEAFPEEEQAFLKAWGLG
ncbi:MAG: sugar ABC transporter substrate-binding protein [Actinobacteria bacterium]|nr:sugar ABC transporter substrate-binding protein [Actinomycetota bacterium]